MLLKSRWVMVNPTPPPSQAQDVTLMQCLLPSTKPRKDCPGRGWEETPQGHFHSLWAWFQSSAQDVIQDTVKATFEHRTADLPFRVRNWLICFSDLLPRNRADRSSLTKRMPDAMPPPNGNLGKTLSTTRRVHSATYSTTDATHHSPLHRWPRNAEQKQSGKTFRNLYRAEKIQPRRQTAQIWCLFGDGENRHVL